jgi:hypothetical protein
MGSVTLMAVPHEESDLTALRADVPKHRRQTARKRLLGNTRKAGRVRAAAGMRAPSDSWRRGTASFALLTDPELSGKLWELIRQ